MKKVITTLVVVLGLGFIGYHAADAASGTGRGFGPGGCGGFGRGMMGNCWSAQDEETVAAREAFLAETTELRRDARIKRTELAAVARNENADPTEIAALQSELADLQAELKKIAAEKGLPAAGPESCPGPGNRDGNGRSSSDVRRGPGYRGQAPQGTVGL
jgi:Spy/CpxP family protein refolding chaperone